MKGSTARESGSGRTAASRGGAGAGRTSGSHRAPESAAASAWEWLKSIVIAVLLFLVIRTFLVQAFTIPSGSMENTLLIGDYLMANNAVYGAKVPGLGWRTPALREPRHGDVVVFRPEYNDPVIDVVKRIIGEPGDTIEMKDRVVYRNGVKLDEPYLNPDQLPDTPIPLNAHGVPLPPEINPAHYGYQNHLPALLPSVNRVEYHPTADNWGPLVVPEGHYMLLGDNRDQSLDSRYMGFIPRDVIRGKAMFIYFSVDQTANTPFPHFLTAARWSRLGDVIR